MVSIHAPRVGRDLRRGCHRSGDTGFNPRAPRGARPQQVLARLILLCFNPRAPRGARRHDFV